MAMIHVVDDFDLFTYPGRPGFKEPTTSRDAARRIAGRAPSLREQALKALQVAWPGGLTADEVAAKVGKPVLSIRPRVTELLRLGEIMPVTWNASGEPLRRANASGADATVWVCRRPEGGSDGA